MVKEDDIPPVLDGVALVTLAGQVVGRGPMAGLAIAVTDVFIFDVVPVADTVMASRALAGPVVGRGGMAGLALDTPAVVSGDGIPIIDIVATGAFFGGVTGRRLVAGLAIAAAAMLSPGPTFSPVTTGTLTGLVTGWL